MRGLRCLDLTTPRATYVMRSILAAWLALVLAFLLDLHAPYAAASSVLLVINPVQGAVIGKGIWRVIGTLVGMLAAFVLMSAFGQMPWLFLLGVGLWLGACVAAMTLLRHFRAYGATLAGYTVGLAAYGAMQNPQLTFDQVMGRGASVLIGVASLGVVSALFSRRGARSRLTAQLHRLAASAADVLARDIQARDIQALQDPNRQGGKALDAGRRSLVVDIYAVDDLLALGKAESADLARRAATVRRAMVSLFSALVGGVAPMRPGGASLQALAALQPAWEQAWRQASEALARDPGPGGLDLAARSLSAMRARLAQTLAAATTDDPRAHAVLMIAGDRLIEQLDDYLEVLAGIAVLHQHRRPAAAPVPVPFHRDTGAALQNGLRALLTVLLGGAFWMATGWSNGNLMLAGLAAACGLLSTAPNPALGAVALIQGTIAAVVMAFLCAFLVLPQVSGLPLLLVVLALFWLPGVYASAMPRYGLAGVAYLVAFTTLVATDNPMRYDVASFLNGAVAWILVAFFTLLGFRIVLPRNPSRDMARLRLAIRDDALALLRGGRADARAWQWRQQHRTAQLGALLRTRPDAMDRTIADALASIHLGRELLRLRQGWRRMPADARPRRLLAVALRHMRRRAGEPRLAARHARRAAQSLSRLTPAEGAAPADIGRSRAMLLDIAALLEDHADYFSRRPGRPSHAQ
ncbi:FUSC family protein [Achromobacter insuavis]|uniref:FUSC family protein n=1 Tax=Achromobacter insuavis TaxID=1287735 RepID=UPI001F139F8E